MSLPSRAACAVALVAAACGPPLVAPERLVGVWHAVAPGETATSIAGAYGASPAAVAEVNDLAPDAPIAERTEVFVPKAGGEPPGTGAAPAPPPAAWASAGGEPSSAAAKAAATSARCGEGGRPCLEWPARGEIAAGFGVRGGAQHDGLDIAAPKGTPVVAAEAGRVVYAGDGIQGYGNMILVKHEGGLITVYAHNDANAVRDGDTVARGQKIATVGQSGSATAPHLHFEVRTGEEPADPLAYLPRKEDGR